MIRKNIKKQRGFTLTELAAASLITGIVILAVGIAMADGVRGFQQVFDSANNDLVVSAYTAQKAFDRIVRSASYKLYPYTNIDFSTLDVYYISNPVLYSAVDRRAHFWVDGTTLKVTHYTVPQGISQNSENLCENVSEIEFKVNNRSAQMMITLDDGKRTVTTTGSAYLHN